jgi:hypothetical protein
MIPAADRWGPFADGIEEAEQRARLRSLRVLAGVYRGPRAADFCRLLALAETHPAALEPASRALNQLTAADRRQLWASYAALVRAAR